MMTKTTRRWVAVLACGALAMAACGGDDTSSEDPTSDSSGSGDAGGAEVELQKASLRLDWTYGTFHAPFLYAKEHGYYEEEGIDLDIREGQGSAQTMTLVGGGDDTFGWGDSGTAALQISLGVPLKVVAVVQRQTPFGVACFDDVGYTEPADLVGHSVVLVPQESTAQLWPAFLEANGIAADDVRVVNADFSNKVTLFAEHRADCMAGYPSVDILQAQQLNDEIGEAVSWDDNGVHVLSQGLVTTTGTIEDDPELVAGFVRASLRAWKEICADPDLGSSFFIEQFPELHKTDDQIAYSEESMVRECAITEARAGTGATTFGPSTDDEWQPMLDLLHKFGTLENLEEPSTYYTNDFIEG